MLLPNLIPLIDVTFSTPTPVVANNLNVRSLTAKPSPGTMGTMSATFEQWLEFVFNNPVRKREWYWDEDFDSRWKELELTDALIVQYMTRLFLEPGVLRSYSLDQVEQGLWFLLGESSPGCSSKTLLRHEAALLDRVACI